MAEKIGGTDKNNARLHLLRTLSRLGLSKSLTVQEEIRLAQRYYQGPPKYSTEQNMFRGGACGPNLFGSTK